MRTDDHNNPTAFTTAIAKQAGLELNKDYVQGDPFENGKFFTARLLGDPVDLTIKVIDKLGFYTTVPHQRWTYIAIPFSLWLNLTKGQKAYIIGFMYQNEGGTAMKDLFPKSL